jgi:hypothetical protein
MIFKQSYYINCIINDPKGEASLTFLCKLKHFCILYVVFGTIRKDCIPKFLRVIHKGKYPVGFVSLGTTGYRNRK